jgi:N-(2-amino-2-carboxyethyl)-L-glutamate synthase
MRAERIDDLIGRGAERALAGIGATPMWPVTLLVGGRARVAHLKVEGENPCGSIKDRTALALVTSLERGGRLRSDSVLVESTSGNLGVALALIARARGYPFVAVVDPKTTAENLARMRALGATIEMVDAPDHTGGYLVSRLRRVAALCASSPRFVWTDQYSNPANPAAHYKGTGPEIRRQMPATVKAVFIPVSTGGTLAGIGRYLRETSPATEIVAVDARGSVIFGGQPGPRRLTGIGSSRASAFVGPRLYDDHILVGDEAAFTACRMLARATGIRVGGSSGAALAACAQYLGRHPDVREIVCVCPDHGDNYSTSIYSDAWLRRAGLWPLPGRVPWVDDIRPAMRSAAVAGSPRGA